MTETRCPVVRDGRQCVLPAFHDSSMNATPHEFRTFVEERRAESEALYRRMSTERLELMKRVLIADRDGDNIPFVDKADEQQYRFHIESFAQDRIDIIDRILRERVLGTPEPEHPL